MCVCVCVTDISCIYDMCMCVHSNYVCVCSVYEYVCIVDTCMIVNMYDTIHVGRYVSMIIMLVFPTCICVLRVCVRERERESVCV